MELDIVNDVETFEAHDNLVQTLDVNAFKAGDPVVAIENTIMPCHALGLDWAKWFEAHSSKHSRSACVQRLHRRCTDTCQHTWAHLRTCTKNHFMDKFTEGLRLATEALRNNGDVVVDAQSAQVSFINMQRIHFGVDRALSSHEW